MLSKKIKSLQKHQIENIKFYRDHLKARQATVASAAFRNELLTRQDTINYKNEYNRLKNALETNSSMPFETRQRVEARKNHLQTLAAKALP